MDHAEIHKAILHTCTYIDLDKSGYQVNNFLISR